MTHAQDEEADDDSDTKKLSKSTKCGTHLQCVCSLSHSLLYHGTVVKHVVFNDSYFISL